jgi:hypothetical protein
VVAPLRTMLPVEQVMATMAAQHRIQPDLTRLQGEEALVQLDKAHSQTQIHQIMVAPEGQTQLLVWQLITLAEAEAVILQLRLGA